MPLCHFKVTVASGSCHTFSFICFSVCINDNSQFSFHREDLKSAMAWINRTPKKCLHIKQSANHDKCIGFKIDFEVTQSPENHVRHPACPQISEQNPQLCMPQYDQDKSHFWKSGLCHGRYSAWHYLFLLCVPGNILLARQATCICAKILMAEGRSLDFQFEMIAFQRCKWAA